MPPRQADTRERILDLAEELLQERGFNAFSYQHIAERLGVKNAAIHYHFPSKGELGVALVARYEERFQAFAAQVDEEEADAGKRLDRYLGIAVSYLRHGTRICPLGVLEAEFHTISEPMQEAVQALDKAMRTWLEQILLAGQAAGQFEFRGSAHDKALLLTATVQGALQIARVAGPKTFFSTLRQLKDEITR